MADKTNDALFDMDSAPETSSYLDKRKKNEDGLFRPKLEQARDKNKGYLMTMRFLPNLRRDGTLGPTALEKPMHYADFKDDKSISGYYDCPKHFDEKCEMCNMFWALKNSKNPADNDKAKKISRSTKYYSYVQIIEDENQPDMVGKILIFPFGYKIKEMIKAKKEHPKYPCRVEDLNDGMEFLLHIKEVGGFTNYDSSSFVDRDRGPLKIQDKTGKWQTLPVDESGKIQAKYRDKVKDLLLSREVELDDFAPVKWTDEQRGKVDQILSVLSGQEHVSDVNLGKKNVAAEDVFSKPSTDAASATEEFFAEPAANAPAKAAKAKATATPAAKVEEKDPFFEDEDPFA